MTTINLTNQRTKVNAALPTIQAYQAEMDLRRTVWDKLSPEQRKRWVQSSNGTLAAAKDPVMWLSLKLKQYLDEWEIQDNG